MPQQTLPPTPVERLLRPFNRFLHAESSGGLVLIACAVVALIWANSPAYHAYEDLWHHTTFTIGTPDYNLTKTLGHWINDGLMAVFFLLVGMEIKRELLGGELSSPRRAALPMTAALGGMVVPALIYSALNFRGPGSAGWGIPMATDIAFALGVLALLGPRVPLSLKVFLAAVAIVDDLGAVLVIAMFYTSQLDWASLGYAAVCMGLLIACNRLGVRRASVYVLIGSFLWFAVLKSGIHATIAGVLLATTIPDRHRIDPGSFHRLTSNLVDHFGRAIRTGDEQLSREQEDTVATLERACEAVETPLRRLEHFLVPWVAFLIMPIFALANAGVHLSGDAMKALTEPVTLGVLLGLVVGKPIGVLGASWLAVRAGIAALPMGITWGHLAGVSMLCGIGFTMSLFIADLAFRTPELLNEAKLGIMAASGVAAVLGVAWLALTPRPAPAANRTPTLERATSVVES